MTLFFRDHAIDHHAAARITGKVPQAAVEREDAVGSPYGVVQNLTLGLLTEEPAARVPIAIEPGQPGHDLGIGQDVVVRIEAAKFTRLFRILTPNATPCLLTADPPGRQLAADATSRGIVKLSGRLQIESRGSVFYFLGYFENVEDIETRIHDSFP
ncbi:MAG: hypothetical protein JW993_11060 [Sedimentisphaerales bacterium]|nr:hypothetical protein [Sedimentisphaerales bacterium]